MRRNSMLHLELSPASAGDGRPATAVTPRQQLRRATNKRLEVSLASANDGAQLAIRWGLVRAEVWRILRDERVAKGMSVMDANARLLKQLWSSTLASWQTQRARIALHDFRTKHEAMSDRELQCLVQYSTIKTVPRYTKLYIHGDPMITSFILLQGVMSRGDYEPVWRRQPPRTQFDIGELLGNGAWIDDAVHIDTATAQTACVLLAVRTSEARSDSRLSELSSRLAASLGAAWKAETLCAHVPVFRDLPATVCDQLAPLLTPRLVPPRKRLIKEGDVATSLYVLVLGKVECYTRNASGAEGTVSLRVIARSSEVTYFGEAALAYDCPSACSVRATAPCLLFELNRNDFSRFAKLLPSVRERAVQITKYNEATLQEADALVSHERAVQLTKYNEAVVSQRRHQTEPNSTKQIVQQKETVGRRALRRSSSEGARSFWEEACSASTSKDSRQLMKAEELSPSPLLDAYQRVMKDADDELGPIIPPLATSRTCGTPSPTLMRMTHAASRRPSTARY